MNELTLKKIQKDFGNVLIDAQQFADSKQEIISISPGIDLITNGGIPMGSWLNVIGKEKMGKTTMILTLARNAQKKLGIPIMYGDVEHRLKAMNLKGVPGLDLSPTMFIPVRSSKEKILYCKDYLNIFLEFLKSGQCMLIIDSLSALANDTIADDGIGTETMGRQNKYISDFINCAVPLVAVHHSLIVIVGQYYMNPGMGKNNVAKIPSRAKYQGDVQLTIQGNYPKYIYESGNKDPVGQELTLDCDYAALPGGPGKGITSYIRYNYGIDDVAELANFGVMLGFIKKGGAWYTLDYLEQEPPVKVQGETNLFNLIRENPEYLDKLKPLVYKEIL